MIKRDLILIALILVIAVIATACDMGIENDEEQQLPPTGTSVGGALLQTGPDIDDQWELVSVQHFFQAGEEFYFHFHNNMPFDAEQVTIRLIENGSADVLAENTYQVNPDEKSITDKIWFGSPGRYTITAEIGEEVRATREVIIE